MRLFLQYCVALCVGVFCQFLCASTDGMECPPWGVPDLNLDDVHQQHCAREACVAETLSERSEGFEQIWLDENSQVRLVYLPKNGERYSIMYNVRDQYLRVQCLLPAGWTYTGNRPVECVVKDEFLKGYILKEGRSCYALASPYLRSTDVCLKDYEQKSFLSRPLHNFLSRVCLHQEASREFIQDATLWQPLTKDILTKITLPRKDIRWNLCDEERFLYTVVAERRVQPEIFLIAREEGFLRGTFERRGLFTFAKREAAPKRSLFEYKMRKSHHFFWGARVTGSGFVFS